MPHLRLINRYLNLLEAALIGALHADPSIDPWHGQAYDPIARSLGADWPARAQSMIGRARMRNLRQCCESVILDGVPGDFVETGVWRGGACIFMRGLLEAYAEPSRRVFVADSFRGLPPPAPEQFPADQGSDFHVHRELAISRAQVEENFRLYGLLDERVVFLEGWFRDTLPTAPIEHVAVLRLDGDMYESTIQTLDALYAKVSRGGCVIIDDYTLPPCAQAVHEFRARHGITAPILPIDNFGAWWRVDHAPLARG